MLIRDVVRVHRLEYPFPVIYVCHVLWGASFAATSLDQLLAVPVLLALIANLVPLIAQNPLNGACDVRADSVVPGKEGIAAATLRLGRDRVIRWAFAELAVALGLAVLTGNVVVMLAVAAGVVIELLYNLEPVRLKRRGWANPVFLGMHFSFLPFIGTFAVVRHGQEIQHFPGWALALAFGLWGLLMGRTLWWSLPDARADAAVGDRTVAVRLGVRRSRVAVAALTAAGLLLAGGGLWHISPLWSIVVVVTQGLFLTHKTLREKAMRTRALTMVMVGDVLLVLIPLGALL